MQVMGFNEKYEEGKGRAEGLLHNFSWVVEEEIAAMAAPVFCGGEEDRIRDSLSSLEITAAVSLTQRSYGDLFSPPRFAYLHEPVTDMGVPTLEQLERVLEFIGSHVERGGRVVVHCGAGYGRTGTVLACYLVRRGCTAWEAIDQLRRIRPGSVETGKQETLVVEYYARLLEEKVALNEGGKMPLSSKYASPSVAVDAAIFGANEEELRILLVKRGKEPFQNFWALPGGFVHMEEGLEDAVRREIKEETGLGDLPLEQFRTYGDPGRDPRGRIISVVYFGLLSQADPQPAAGSDAQEVQWFPVEKVPQLAFDHNRILAEVLDRIRDRMKSDH